VSATKTNRKRNSRNAAKAAARSAAPVTTRGAANVTSGLATENLKSSGAPMTGFAGAVGSDRRLFSTTSMGTRINIRGALCPNCNRGIGLLGDDIQGVRRALEYLHRYEARKPSTHSTDGRE